MKFVLVLELKDYTKYSLSIVIQRQLTAPVQLKKKYLLFVFVFCICLEIRIKVTNVICRLSSH